MSKDNPFEGYAKKIDVDELFDKEKMKKFNKEMEKVHREFKRKQALSIQSAKDTIITC